MSSEQGQTVPESPVEALVGAPVEESIQTPDEGLLKQQEADNRSVYVGNVDFNSTPAQIEQLFAQAGTISRVTILFSKLNGLPKGCAYVEYADAQSVTQAITQLDGCEFRHRNIRVLPKRTNVPGYAAARGGGHSGGYRSRGRGRGRARGRGRGRGKGSS